MKKKSGGIDCSGLPGCGLSGQSSLTPHSRKLHLNLEVAGGVRGSVGLTELAVFSVLCFLLWCHCGGYPRARPLLKADRVVGPQRKRTRHGFLGIREAIFWLKSFCDLSLATTLALEQVSVINGLREVREYINKGKAVKKQ